MDAKVHSFESFGTVDGPGIRFVLFLQGCPLRCKYCHNPDTWDYSKGQTFTTEEIIQRIIKYKSYFGNKGGVTVSGGEPLLQIDFLIDLFTKLKKYNIHTCVDTSGISFNKENKVLLSKFDKLIEVTDLFLLDIKHINSEKHISLTGMDNHNCLEFAKYLNEKQKKIWIRHVIVPGINLDEESLRATKDFIKTLNNVEKIEILPYHTMGTTKYKNMGLKYPLEGVLEPTDEEIQFARKVLIGD